MTTIEILDPTDPPAPPPPLRPRVAVLAIAILLVGGITLALLAGPETSPGPRAEPGREAPVSPLP